MMLKRELAEFVGTFTLVLIGCGAVVVAGEEGVGLVGIALAFGLTVVAMAYALGPISGCHLNPAISLGSLVAGRMEPLDFIKYVVAQCLGAIAVAWMLMTIASGQADFSLAEVGLGQTGWGEGYGDEYSTKSAFLFELIATAIFVTVVLCVADSHAGLAVGLALVAIHLAGIYISGASVNPARSLGPAVWVGKE